MNCCKWLRRPRSAVGCTAWCACSAATRRDATGSGCIAGCSSKASRMWWWTPRASRSTGVRGVPSVQQEDERRMHRELERLKRERNAHINRMRSLPVLHNVRLGKVGGRGWSERLPQLKEQLPAGLWAEIERERVREQLVCQQMHTLEKSRQEQVKHMSQGPLVALLKLRGIGLTSAWLLTRELFGWRGFGNRRQLAGCAGLNPSPYDSGDCQREQGISKAGNRRVRALLVELAWYWLRYQARSALSAWFTRRFAAGGKRMRRIGIVALARRLLIALWRYVAHGVIPEGAQLKST